MTAETEFERQLEAVVCRELTACTELISVDRLSGGASQETYRLVVLLGGAELPLAMRRATGGHKEPSELGYPDLATEAHLIRSAAAAGVPEPEIHYVLQPEDGVGEGFIMEWLDGEALGSRILRSPDLDSIRPRLAYEFGRALARIHAIDLKSTGLQGMLTDLSPDAYVTMMWEQYQGFETPQPMIDYTARWLLDHLPDSYEPSLVHNDFRNGNVMVDPNGIVAVLDWETAMIGDPMRDLGWICTNSWRFGRSDLPVGGFGTYDDLFAGYEEVSGRAVDRDQVKFWEVFGSFWWAVGCLNMAEHFRTGPDITVERPAIGRRSSECQVDCVNLLIPGPTVVLPTDPAPIQTSISMPTIDELLVSVRDFLRGDVMDATTDRTNFLARVAANSLDIVRREAVTGPQLAALERGRLAQLLDDAEADLRTLKWELVHRLRSGHFTLEDPALIAYLRESVVNQVGIDQPTYSGFKTALEHAS